MNQQTAAATNSTSASLGALVSIPFVLMCGLIYDLFGRMKTVAAMFIMGAVCTVLIPVVSPNVASFIFLRVLLQCTIVPILMNPFINDYVKVRNRGQAMGMQQMGLTVGNLLSIAVLYTVTQLIGPYFGFALMGGLQILWVSIIYFGKMIQEPQVMTDREARRQGRKSVCGKVWSSLKQVYKACQQDHALGIALIAVLVSRNGSSL